MSLPHSIFTYRIIRPSELTEEQRQVLRRVGRARVLERLCSLLGDEKISTSTVQLKYGALMTEVGNA